MASTPEDAAAPLAQTERFDGRRLPCAPALRAKVDRSEVLGDGDMTRSAEAFEDARHVKPFVHKRPDWRRLPTRALELRKAMTDGALAHAQPARVKKS